MAIDDNTVYGLTGAQVKELPERIEAVKGLAKELTSADYNWPTNNPDGVAIWELDTGIYTHASGVKVYYTSSIDRSQSCLFAVHNNGYQTSCLYIRGANANMEYFDVNNANGGVREHFYISQPVNNLTSSSEYAPLSAAQGKVLKDMIDNLPTGGAIELTSADFNYDYGNTGSFNKVALWLLPPGEYYTNTLTVSGILSNTQILSSTSTQFDNQQQMRTFNVIKAPTADGIDYVEIEGYRRLSSDSAGTPAIGLMRVRADGTFDYKTALLDQDMVAQTTGTSTTNVMSQKAVTDALSALEARIAALEGN